MKHDPKYKYDCSNCKFNWCCGISCQCVLKGFPNPPKNIQIKHAEVVQKINQNLSIEEILEDIFA